MTQLTNCKKDHTDPIELAKSLIQDVYYLNIADAIKAIDPDKTSQVDNSPRLKAGTIAVFTLTNGMVITGKAFAIDTENLNQEIGNHIAYQEGFNQIVDLAVFQLCQERNLVGEH